MPRNATLPGLSVAANFLLGCGKLYCSSRVIHTPEAGIPLQPGLATRTFADVSPP